MKNRRPTLCERYLQFGHIKKYCRSDIELCTNCTIYMQEEKMHNFRGHLCLYCKEPNKAGDKKIFGEYKMEATIQNKIRLDKCDAYTAKETLGYRGRKSYVSAARGAAKIEEKQRRIEK